VGCRILLVEDNRLVTDALVVLLESGGGHAVRTAATVADAVVRGAAEPVDVLLLDLTLPDGDGLGVLAGLRSAHAEPAVAVALTGHDDPATIARCRAAGCRAVLLKPVPARELLALVAGWEEEARAAR
jgi:CheY-like chemotaxis protein